MAGTRVRLSGIISRQKLELIALESRFKDRPKSYLAVGHAIKSGGGFPERERFRQNFYFALGSVLQSLV